MRYLHFEQHPDKAEDVSWERSQINKIVSQCHYPLTILFISADDDPSDDLDICMREIERLKGEKGA
jgi:hypothetical protein